MARDEMTDKMMICVKHCEAGDFKPVALSLTKECIHLFNRGAKTKSEQELAAMMLSVIEKCESAEVEELDIESYKDMYDNIKVSDGY
jgi:hypothetical protein